jgi:hypothetical protein
MAILVDTRTGPVVQTDGSGDAPLRQDRTGALVVADAHGRYAESAWRGLLYTASNQAAQAVSVALATTYTGLCISNPLGNTKNLVMLGCNYALSVAPAAIAPLFLIGGYSATANVTHTTPLIAPGIVNALIGTGSPSSAKADSAATIVNPGYLLPLGSGFTAAALYATTPAWIDLGGLIVLPPGGWIAVGALTAVTGFGGFAWEEVQL